MKPLQPITVRFWKPALVCLVALLSLLSNHTWAQELRLRSESDFRPISNVFIYDTQRKTSTLSDSTGLAILNEFKDTDTLVFQHPAYESFTIVKSDLKDWGYTLILSSTFQSIGEVTIVGARHEEKKSEVPYRIQTISSKEIRLSNSATTADLLQTRGEVLVQKSQVGGGSPVLRGFEANRVLLVVDGVRMNNAIYRSGHLQHVITLDNNNMERVEVLFGPGSVMYGSDALGGVMHFVTRNPRLAQNDSTRAFVQTFSRGASATREFTTHADVELGYKKIGFLSSITYSNFGDLQMGSNRSSAYPDFGKINFYADRINGQDVMVPNSDPNRMRRSGYEQYDVMQKVLYRPNSNLDLILNTQFSTSSNVPRYDRLTIFDNDSTLRYADWHYGPQKRLFTSLTSIVRSSNTFFNTLKITAGYQDIEESRISRRFGQSQTQHNEEEVKVASLNADFRKIIDTLSSLQYGIELLHNGVTSNAFTENIESEEIGFRATRYPDGGSEVQSAAVYLGYKKNFGKKWIANLGARYSFVSLQAEIDSNIYDLPFNRIDNKNGALTGSVGLIYRPSPGWQINGVASSGFRAPNVDDIGKIFENGDNLIVPNNDLKPEYVYNAELTVSKSFFEKRLKLHLNGYYSWLQNVMVRTDVQLNGQDSLMFDGQMLNLQSNTNSNRGVIYGGTAGIDWKLNRFFDFAGRYTYTFGRDLSEDVPLGHIPPTFGRLGLNFLKGKVQGSFFTMFNGWKRIEDYSPSGVDNPEEATVDGAPSWYTLNLKGNYQMSKSFGLQLAVENLLDRHYKPFASGISGPGRNFILTLRARL